MKKLYTTLLTSALFCMGFIPSNAQVTLHLRSNASDYLDNYYPTSNYGTSPEMDAIAWTSGSAFISRSVFNFDLSAIPAGSTITSAYLSLWGDTNTSNKQGDSPLSGSNAWYIQRVTSAWNASTVTWNTQPTTTTTNEVSMPQSTSIYEIFNNIDVTNLMQDIINNLPNNGLLIKLQTESIYRSMVFCSSQYPDSAERPLLVITYKTGSTSSDSCVNLRFTQSDYLDNYYPTTNFGTSQEIDAIAWSAGSSFISRSVLDFNFDSIPAGSTITSATLSLYGDSNTSNKQGDSPLSGSNDWYIQRATSPWSGNTVSWNTQPTTTTVDEVHMAQSTSIYEDFPSIDVTALTQDIVNNLPNDYGFLIKLNTEVEYRSMVFCSNYYPNPARRPALNVCYKKPTGFNELSVKPQMSVFPNPTTGSLTLNYSAMNGNNVRYRIFNAVGMLITEDALPGGNSTQSQTITTVGLSAGIYLIQITDGKSILNSKFIKE